VTNAIPESFRPRLFSVRAYDAEAMILDADVSEGAYLEQCFDRLLANSAVDYIHLHQARRGCYACRVDRT
jgi:hypothetical protein